MVIRVTYFTHGQISWIRMKKQARFVFNKVWLFVRRTGMSNEGDSQLFKSWKRYKHTRVLVNVSFLQVDDELELDERRLKFRPFRGDREGDREDDDLALRRGERERE